MLDYKTLYNSDPFNLKIKNKDPWYLVNQKKLCSYHYKNSINYKILVDNIFNPISKIKKISDLPFIHASLFKITILSIKNKKKISTFHSSGTTSLSQSKINLDPKTSLLQSKLLVKFFKNS